MATKFKAKSNLRESKTLTEAKKGRGKGRKKLTPEDWALRKSSMSVTGAGNKNPFAGDF